VGFVDLDGKMVNWNFKSFTLGANWRWGLWDRYGMQVNSNWRYFNFPFLGNKIRNNWIKIAGNSPLQRRR